MIYGVVFQLAPYVLVRNLVSPPVISVTNGSTKARITNFLYHEAVCQNLLKKLVVDICH